MVLHLERAVFGPHPDAEPLAGGVKLAERDYVAAGDRPRKNFEEGVAIIGRAMPVMEQA